METFITVKKRASATFTEKKSVFIGHAAPVGDEDAAKSLIEEIRAKYADATHNVYAFVLRDTGIARFSDDGEPQGTAGMPVLEVIKREKLCGTAVVVTRYFGGILLGAGGLVRAYAKAAKLAIDAAQICEYRLFTEFRLTVAYGFYEKIRKEAERFAVKIDDCTFAESVVLSLAADETQYGAFCRFVNDFTGATARFEITGSRYDAQPT